MVQVIKMSCYNYYDGSYRLNRVTGSIALDSARKASRTNNFVYDASGRMVADSSKNLSVEYDPYGMPVSFVQTLDSSVWRELMVYDASGWRVASLAYENDSLRAIRTDIMVGGKKVLERRRSYIASDSSVAEHRMIQGKSGIVGRILPDSSKEWYIKDYQGSLVMTLVDNGTGNVFAYEPYGAQQKIQVSGESPAEQYTGKELNERVGLYYYGARFFDPVFGIWLSPDAAKQFDNPFHFGGNPVNYVDKDGNIAVVLAVGVFAISVYVGINVADYIYDGTNLGLAILGGFGAAGLSFIGGWVAGAVKGAGGIALSTVASMGETAIENLAKKENFGNATDYIVSGMAGAFSGPLGKFSNTNVLKQSLDGKAENALGSIMLTGGLFAMNQIYENSQWLANAVNSMLYDFNFAVNFPIANSISVPQNQEISTGSLSNNLKIGTHESNNYGGNVLNNYHTSGYNKTLDESYSQPSNSQEQVQHSIDQVQNVTDNQNPKSYINVEIPQTNIDMNEIDDDYQNITNGINSDLENLRHPNNCYVGCNGYTNF